MSGATRCDKMRWIRSIFFQESPIPRLRRQCVHASPDTCVTQTHLQLEERRSAPSEVSLTAGSHLMSANHRPVYSSGSVWSQCSSSFQREGKIVLAPTITCSRFTTGSNGAAVMLRILRLVIGHLMLHSISIKGEWSKKRNLRFGSNGCQEPCRFPCEKA